MEKRFKLGFMVGRMQPIHKGHQQLIDLGLEMCEKFVILLGSSNESRTKNNPLTFEERKSLINTIYGDRVEVYPIVNIGIGYVPEWGNYIMNTIKFYCGELPDFYIGGIEVGRSEAFKNYQDELTQLYVNRNKIKISATKVRDFINNTSVPAKYADPEKLMLAYEAIKNDLKELVDEKIVDKIQEFKNIIHECYIKETNNE